MIGCVMLTLSRTEPYLPILQLWCRLCYKIAFVVMSHRFSRQGLQSLAHLVAYPRRIEKALANQRRLLAKFTDDCIPKRHHRAAMSRPLDGGER